MQELLDKVALVTGGAKRIGRGIALALANDGCDIVLHYRESRTEADALAREIRAAGRQAWCVGGDFSEPGAAAKVMRTAWDAAGWVDILVNNASEYSHATADDAAAEDVERLFRVNLFAPMELARTMRALAAECEILPADYVGCVVNVVDRAVAKPSETGSPYWLSKRALADFTKSAALAFAPGFRVNAVAPGPVLPPADIELTEPAGQLPLGRKPSVGEIADGVLALARARSVTGQILYVDGGQHLL